MFTVGIDAINLRHGGGITHLVGLLEQADPRAHGCERVIVWAGKSTLDALPNAPWLTRICPSDANKSLLFRLRWQRYVLPREAQHEGCSILFVPGGSHSGKFRPVVTMSQNLLPFEWREMIRYGVSFNLLKLFVRRMSQSNTFKRSDGLIFLTRYAQQAVHKVTGPLQCEERLISHGVDSRFANPPRRQRRVEACAHSRPFRILYVSIVSAYKHQWHVLDAVAKLRSATGWALTIDFVGAAHFPSLRKLRRQMSKHDGQGRWATYRGEMKHEDLPAIYSAADVVVFASSCENQPIILIEAMSAGLPIACSNMGPMPEVLGDAGVYFAPEDPGSIANALYKLMISPDLRSDLAQKAYERAKGYSWRLCSDQTFGFLADVVQNSPRSSL